MDVYSWIFYLLVLVWASVPLDINLRGRCRKLCVRIPGCIVTGQYRTCAVSPSGLGLQQHLFMIWESKEWSLVWYKALHEPEIVSWASRIWGCSGLVRTCIQERPGTERKGREVFAGLRIRIFFFFLSLHSLFFQKHFIKCLGCSHETRVLAHFDCRDPYISWPQGGAQMTQNILSGCVKLRSVCVKAFSMSECQFQTENLRDAPFSGLLGLL